MRFSLALFDLDGTLVDSAPDIAAALNAAMSEAALPQLPPAQVTAYVGDGATRLVQRALHVDATTSVDPLVDRFRWHYARHLHDLTRPYPGIEDVLQRLSATMPLAVLTNKPGELARPLLEGLGLARYFAAIVGDGDGFPRKPAPDAARALMERHGVAPDRVLVVGDGLPDLQMARAAGAHAAAVTWGYVARDLLAAERPTWMVDAAAQLFAIAAGE